MGKMAGLGERGKAGSIGLRRQGPLAYRSRLSHLKKGDVALTSPFLTPSSFLIQNCLKFPGSSLLKLTHQIRFELIRGDFTNDIGVYGFKQNCI